MRAMSSRHLIPFVVAAAALAAEPEVLLWPNGAPGSEGKTGGEIEVTRDGKADFQRIRNIHKPSVTVFLPPREKANGTAMIIAPGGGHTLLAIEHEGYNVARYLNSIGVAGFVLKYRLANEPESTYKVEIHALADAQQAIRTVRARAAEWGVKPDRVGIMGFSAGGHLAALASTSFKPDTRPDFQALIYPGKGAEAARISQDTPPAFLLCAGNDSGPAAAISALYQQFVQMGVPVELHIYNSGGHGFGIRPGTHASPIMDTWCLRLRDWMADRGLL